MRQASGVFRLETRGQGLLEFTDAVLAWIAGQDIDEGLLTLFCRHTSASLLIQENAAPAVQRDIAAFFAEIAPEDAARYEHDDEGPDDMPAHLRTALTTVQLSIPVQGGRPVLGTWQDMDRIKPTGGFEHGRRRTHRFHHRKASRASSREVPRSTH